MKKILAVTILGAILGLGFASGAAAHTARQAAPTATPAPTPAPPPPASPPIQGANMNVVLYVDTVQGAAGNPKPAVGCSQTNLFRQGQQVVFRMWGINVRDKGVALTAKNVVSAVVNIPGVDPIKMTYGSHGTYPNMASFWSAPWSTAGYPLGMVDFTIVVKTKADKANHVKAMTATYTQAGFSVNSRLTVTP